MRYITKMSKTGIALTLSLVLGCLGVLTLPSLAFGASSRTLYVGHGTIGSGKSCDSPGYNDVQDAVDAANKGDTVYLCGGQFAEQVFVDKSITLTGDKSSGLTAVGTTFTTSTARYPSAFNTDGLFVPQALLVITGSATAATIDGLTISGPMPGNGSCGEDEFGILALEGHVNLSGDKVLNIADSSNLLYGCQFGTGIQIGREYWPLPSFNDTIENFAATASIDNVQVSGYQKNGITVDGAGSQADIMDSQVTGNGRGVFGAIIAQNGIQISRGAKASVINNTVSENDYTGSGFASSGGILVYGGGGDPLSVGVMVEGNHLVNNDVGIYLNNYNDNFSGAASTPTRDEAINNVISDDAVTNISGLCIAGEVYCGDQLIGYQAGINDIGNKDVIVGNHISGPGYEPQGSYVYSPTASIFTKEGPDNVLIRPIDAGYSFPTIDAMVYGND